MIKFVVIESPFAGKTFIERERNMAYLRAAMNACFQRGEIPFASHGLYTQPGVLDDNDPEERQKGIQAGFAVAEALHQAALCDLSDRTEFSRVFFMDRGCSSGMRLAEEDAIEKNQNREMRWLGAEWSKDNDCPAALQVV